ncbi:MAG: S41 family peptidase, partial [Terriglobia bacterium]
MRTRPCVCPLLLLALAVVWAPAARAQKKMSVGDRNVALEILKVMKKDLERYYFDPEFQGVDVEARFAQAEQIIREKATNLNAAFRMIAWAMDGLNDSHTMFLQPPRPFDHTFGWTMQIVGDECVVTGVKPGSDAEAKGLKAGDVVVSLNGVPVVRGSFWKIQYLINVLDPQPGLRLVARSPEGEERTVDVLAKIKQSPRVVRSLYVDFLKWQKFRRRMRQQYIEVGDDVLVWKLPTFAVHERAIDGGIKRAREKRALVLDLRGNPGGLVDTLLRMIGSLFDRDVEVATTKYRKKEEEEKAETRGDKAFTGELWVLVDSGSGSAAEIMARVIQLEGRGRVLGDRTSGKVMQSRYHDHEVGLYRVILYGAAITNADVIMKDGKSLEHVGVMPDEVVLPTPADIAAGRDPVLAYAVGLAGAKVSPEEAGS